MERIKILTLEVMQCKISGYFSSDIEYSNKWVSRFWVMIFGGQVA
jgi:hypothetical protein